MQRAIRPNAFFLPMDLFTLITLLIVVAAAVAYLNTRLLKLPNAIGIMVVSLGFSLLLALGSVRPAWFELAR